ncbi:MAG: RNA polymerase sporulation sigma factor SigK [Clostridia bacterium]|nr:RNA polymerase sporulation sigma factor SigK [Clostridia bacterium]
MLYWFINYILCLLPLVGQVGGNFPKPLSEAEESECLTRYKNGDNEARNTLIEHNLRLVAHIVKKYSGTMDNDDLISIGTIGLIKGIMSFDADKNTRLATYAARCVENEILMSLRHDKKFANQVSLQEPIGFDGEGNEVSLMEVLQSDSEDIEGKLDTRNMVSRIYSKIRALLDDREKQVLRLRYGLSGAATLTQREVARLLGISRSYVSRIEKKAINKLKQ